MATTTTLTIPLWINGREEIPSSTFPVISPQTNSPCWHAASASVSDAIRAVESAQAAFPAWSKTKPALKQKILFKAADLLEQRAKENGEIMRTEMGTDVGASDYFVVPLGISMMRDIASLIPGIVGGVPTSGGEGTSAMIWKEPYGVTLGITPWNAPYVFAVRAAATAIATGNTTVLKGSEFTPRSFWAVGKAFADAGLPPGVLNILSCEPSKAPEIVTAMIEHPAIKHINFTGSAGVGRKIARSCGQNLKPCLMELGGKNSAIILPDADVEKAVGLCLAGAFLNSGQICMSTDRIIIHAEIADKFLATLRARLAGMANGSEPLPFVVSAASKSRLEALISDAVSKGAHDLTNKNNTAPTKAGEEAIFVPTILGDVTEKMGIWQEEAFGPLVGYVIAKDEDEAVKIANSTEYGLSAAVFTKDLRKGFAIAKRLETGAVHINNMTVRDEVALPFGGVKGSGWGRFNTARGMEEFLVTKSVTWDD